MSFTYADAATVRATVSMADAVDAVRNAFVGLANDEFELPVRLGLGNASFLVMSVRHAVSESATVKTISLNFDRVPAITGTIAYNELRRPGTLVVDAAAVTVLRTGAASGVATDLMAPADANRLVVIGAGAQAPAQVLAVNAVRPLASVCVVGRNPQRAEQLAASLRDQLPDALISVASEANSALTDAQIICTATNSHSPVFDADALPGKVHINAIGAFQPSMRELSTETLVTSDIVVDQVEAALEESGEIIHALEAEAISLSSLSELGPSLVNPPTFGARTVFKSVGVAIQDWAIVRLLAQRLLD